MCKCGLPKAPAEERHRCRREEDLAKEPKKPAKSKTECPKCGSVVTVQPDVTFCPSCGWRNSKVSIAGWAEDENRSKEYASAQWEMYDPDKEDTGRQADGSLNGPFPPDLGRWNWGAFAFSWIWATAHNIWLLVALGFIFWFAGMWMLAIRSQTFYLAFFAMIAMAVTLGIFGNQMAWRTRKFSGKDEFIECQQVWEAWAIVGAILWVLQVIAGVMMMTQI